MYGRDVSVEFRDVLYAVEGKTILSQLSFDLYTGETLVLLGRSGSGKSTVLKLINGMLFPTSGDVLVQGRSTREWDPIRLRRTVGYVIQGTGLFPHFTAAANVGVVPMLEGWPQATIDQRVTELLDAVGLPAGEFRHRYPHQLSGGQQQRVGVARALAARPSLLIFDEPFGALDPITRTELQRQFRALRNTNRTTSLFVTHDVREALMLGERIAVLTHGTLDSILPTSAFPNARTPEARAFLDCLC